MAGGTFTARNKVRAGAYINFVSAFSPLGTVSDRGVVLLPMAVPFGPVGEPVTVDGETDVRAVFGLSSLSPELKLLREAAKRAREVIVWRLSGGETASETDGNLTVTARYPGSVGNTLAVKVLEPEEADAPYTVQTFLDGRLMEEQQAETVDGLQDNQWVAFSGTGALQPHAGIVLSGGTDAEPEDADWEDFFAAAKRLSYNTMAVPSSDASIKQMAVSFVKEMREEEGVKIQAVLPNIEADYEGIISVKGGVKLSDGTEVSEAEATAYVAGMTAGAAVNKSNTFESYDGAVAVLTPLLSSEIIKGLNAGQFIFIERGNKVVVEQDINTFVSFTADKGEAFRKNRTLRVMDAIANDVRATFEDHYLGKCANNADGRELFREELFAYLTQLYELQAVERPELADIIVSRGDTADSVIVEMGVQPVDAMEKLYMTVTVG